jgi:hypothetical protein
MRQRGAIEDASSSSDEDEYAFARLSSKHGNKGDKTATTTILSQSASSLLVSSSNDGLIFKSQEEKTNLLLETTPSPLDLPASTTSSNLRHHLTANDTRKARMNALLQELEVEKSKTRSLGVGGRSNYAPEKKGSFVDPSEVSRWRTPRPPQPQC